MIDTYEITVYGVKSTRKNAKFNYKSFRVWDTEGAKSEFNYSDVAELNQWVDNNPYEMFNVVVYHNGLCMHSWAKSLMSEYQVKRMVKEWFKLINKGGF